MGIPYICSHRELRDIDSPPPGQAGWLHESAGKSRQTVMVLGARGDGRHKDRKAIGGAADSA